MGAGPHAGRLSVQQRFTRGPQLCIHQQKCSGQLCWVQTCEWWGVGHCSTCPVGTTRMVEGPASPALGRALQAAAGEVPFSPSLRTGRATLPKNQPCRHTDLARTRGTQGSLRTGLVPVAKSSRPVCSAKTYFRRKEQGKKAGGDHGGREWRPPLSPFGCGWSRRTHHPCRQLCPARLPSCEPTGVSGPTGGRGAQGSGRPHSDGAAILGHGLLGTGTQDTGSAGAPGRKLQLLAASKKPRRAEGWGGTAVRLGRCAEEPRGLAGVVENGCERPASRGHGRAVAIAGNVCRGSEHRLGAGHVGGPDRHALPCTALPRTASCRF